jgi:hypothetical protein
VQQAIMRARRDGEGGRRGGTRRGHERSGEVDNRSEDHRDALEGRPGSLGPIGGRTAPRTCRRSTSWST